MGYHVKLALKDKRKLSKLVGRPKKSTGTIEGVGRPRKLSWKESRVNGQFPQQKKNSSVKIWGTKEFSNQKSKE